MAVGAGNTALCPFMALVSGREQRLVWVGSWAGNSRRGESWLEALGSWDIVGRLTMGKAKMGPDLNRFGVWELRWLY